MKPHPAPSSSWISQFSVCAISLVLLIGSASCRRADPQEKPANIELVEEASAEGKVSGGSLNAFFPKDEGDWDVIYTQEKEGFSQAKLEKDGAEVATLSVSDFSENAAGRAKFEASTMKIAGLAAQARGKKGTVVLAGRFQVSVRSKDNSFTEDDRKAWIQKFDLTGLQALAN